MEKKLYKSRSGKMIDGVAAGIAEYFSLDVTLVRLAWVIFTFAGGAGILAYIIAMIIVPAKPEPGDGSIDSEENIKKNLNSRLIFGTVLIFAGFYLLAKDTFLFSLNKYALPILIIAGGIYLIVQEKITR